MKLHSLLFATPLLACAAVPAQAAMVEDLDLASFEAGQGLQQGFESLDRLVAPTSSGVAHADGLDFTLAPPPPLRLQPAMRPDPGTSITTHWGLAAVWLFGCMLFLSLLGLVAKDRWLR
ncbi:hypothetical protein G3480_17330 [Thiorhodococcus mannitoliphagus]|uniref:Uncharacterized protein n=1 Tax=Thiorhodococcus mannitoliphagus TaxID=329406 RepID=A0A6P1DUN4_9GAMM|nr:hypothetical protein [Thiorhodococcus mannitoliphagus]NEX22047.1 hypothetical protein [Thiorhodococcus mannitoliphagus]